MVGKAAVCGLDTGVEALPSSARDVAISAEIDRGRVIHVMSTTHNMYGSSAVPRPSPAP